MDTARDWLAEFLALDAVPLAPVAPKAEGGDPFGTNGTNGTGKEIPPAASRDGLSAQTAPLARNVQDESRAAPLALPDEIKERAALASSLAGPIPEEWRRGFASLQTMAPPEGMVRGRWHEIINDAGRFLDAWGPQAAALGWVAADVFGINPDSPDVNNSNAGLAVLLEGRLVVAITAETATIQVRQGALQTFRRHRLPGAVLLWELMR